MVYLCIHMKSKKGEKLIISYFRKVAFLSCALLICFNTFSQQSRKDSLSENKLKLVSYTLGSIYVGSLIGLNQLWYADYEQSSFHFFNDNKQWQGIDKVGHVYSAYLGGSIGYHAFRYSGLGKKKSLWYGGGLGFVFLTTVEVFDGFSQEWGFSWGDVLANGMGSALFISQEHYFDAQIVQLKYSFTSSSYRKYRPNVLGEDYTTSLFKDYNGQTYWFSINLNSIYSSIQPKWLNIALGYGADGMINAKGSYLSNEGRIIEPFSQYYVSLDVDCSKIKTPYKGLNAVLKALNFIKVPSPTYEINTGHSNKMYWLFF